MSEHNIVLYGAAPFTPEPIGPAVPLSPPVQPLNPWHPPGAGTTTPTGVTTATVRQKTVWARARAWAIVRVYPDGRREWWTTSGWQSAWTSRLLYVDRTAALKESGRGRQEGWDTRLVPVVRRA